MMKIKIFILALIVLMLAGCSNGSEPGRTRYSSSFFDTFDTVVQVVAYTETEEEFDRYFEQIHKRFIELHQLYNIYLSYDGVNNIKTINDNAGIQPVKVEQEIIDLLIYARDLYPQTGFTTNIAMGPVLQIWRKYRDEAEFDPENAKVPPMDELREANQYTDINLIEIDQDNNTVYLPHPRMSLDVGAVAKGYATELVARELEAAGMDSAVLSPGGNIRTIGKPLDGVREKWGIGIQNPDASIIADAEERLLDVVFVLDAAVVSSGDYQRYYIVDGQVMHHIIDPQTLMPGRYYRALTVIADDAGLADFMSTALFLLPFDESLMLANSFDNLEVYWVFTDGHVEITDGLRSMLRSYGVSNELAE